MGLLTKIESVRAWKRLHLPHPYGATAELCHMSKPLEGTAVTCREVGLDTMANNAIITKRLVDRKVIITRTTAIRTLLANQE